MPRSAPSVPLLDLDAAGLKRVLLAFSLKVQPPLRVRFNTLAKKSPDRHHIYSSHRYRVGPKKHGVTITAHLPANARDRTVLAEIEYRSGVWPSPAPAPLSALWRLLQMAEPEETAVVRALAEADENAASALPIKLPLTLPELSRADRVVGVDLVHDEPPDHSYTLSVAYLPDKSYSLVITFAEKVNSLTEGIPLLVEQAGGVLTSVLGERHE